MEFDTTVTAVAVAVLFAAVAGGTLMSGMPVRITLMMVLPGLLIFTLLTFYVGVKHGEYRARSSA